MADYGKATATSAFGSGRRENHDSSTFYSRFVAPFISTDETVNEVTGLGDGCISLRDEITKDIFQASVEAVSKHTMLAWAMVYPKVQGCTETGTVMLHDMRSPYLRRCHLYVGLSRVTDGSNAFISRSSSCVLATAFGRCGHSCRNPILPPKSERRN